MRQDLSIWPQSPKDQRRSSDIVGTRQMKQSLGVRKLRFARQGLLANIHALVIIESCDENDTVTLLSSDKFLTSIETRFQRLHICLFASKPLELDWPSLPQLRPRYAGAALPHPQILRAANPSAQLPRSWASIRAYQQKRRTSQRKTGRKTRVPEGLRPPRILARPAQPHSARLTLGHFTIVTNFEGIHQVA